MRTDPERACQCFGVGTILHDIAVNLGGPHFDDDGFAVDDDHEITEYTGPQNHRGVVDYIANRYFELPFFSIFTIIKIHIYLKGDAQINFHTDNAILMFHHTPSPSPKTSIYKLPSEHIPLNANV